ncbi:MAG: hypothetical protein GXO85_00755 [Chlorobi bacterium]|nr:hypothetical protein [Chlorobiota bacterium]
MNTQLKLFSLLPIFALLLIISCKESINQPKTITSDLNSRDTIPNNPIFNQLGLDKSVKTYSYTVSEINLTTNKPTHYPPDSLINTIQFPDSLYKKGIFIYGTMEETIDIVGDTMFITHEERGYNLFVLLNNPGSDGSVGGGLKFKYFADSNIIYAFNVYFDEGINRAVKYKIPFEVGDTYISVEDTVTVIGEVEINTKAGNFNAIKLKRERMLNPNYRRLEFLYLVENIGICLHEVSYFEKKTDITDGSSIVIEQYQRRELIDF